MRQWFNQLSRSAKILALMGAGATMYISYLGVLVMFSSTTPPVSTSGAQAIRTASPTSAQVSLGATPTSATATSFPVTPGPTATSANTPTPTPTPYRTPTPIPTPAPEWIRVGLEDENVTTVEFGYDTIYASTRGNYHGIFKLVDGNWVAINNGLGSLDVNDISVAPDNPQVIYAATIDGIWRSDNGGDAWLSVADNTRWSRDFWRVVALSDNLVYATTPIEFFRGNAAGLDVVRGVEYPKTVVVAPPDPSTLYLMSMESGRSPKGVFKSVDGGVSWQRVADVGQSYRVRAMCVDVHNSDHVYAGTAKSHFLYGWSAAGWGIYGSKDGGWSWLPINNTVPNQGHGIGVRTLLCDPVRPLTVYALLSEQKDEYGYEQEQIGIYVTKGGGESWEKVGSYLPAWINTLAIDPNNPSTLYAATSDGVWSLDLSMFEYRMLRQNDLEQIVDTWLRSAIQMEGNCRAIEGIEGRDFSCAYS